MVARILMPLPRYGFDPTEAAVPYVYFRSLGHQIIVTTPDASAAQADRRMVTGEDLGLLAPSLRANQYGQRAYAEMIQTRAFKKPSAYEAITFEDFDALLLTGGHDKGMREYLESETIQSLVVKSITSGKPTGAICHGVLLAARSMDPKTGKSVLYGRKTTGLTKRQEMTAYGLTCLWLGDYYLTYPEIAMEDEVLGHLETPSDFAHGPGFPIPFKRDNPSDLSAGFAVRDRNYLSARWPGDAHRFSVEFGKLLLS